MEKERMRSSRIFTMRKVLTYLVVGVLLGALVGATGYYLVSTSVPTATQGDVRTMFDNFIAAQNSHNITQVRNLLLDSPDFLWMRASGVPIFGYDAAVSQFQALYQGTWHLDPNMSALQIVKLSGSGDAWRIYDPILFTTGAAGAQPSQSLILMSMLAVDTPDGLRIASILPTTAATR